jgi:hypothetical protein
MASALGDRVSRRKLRLFHCASARRIWHLFPEPVYQQAVELAERYVDGLATPTELAHVGNRAANLHYQRYMLGAPPALDRLPVHEHSRLHVAVRATLDDDRIVAALGRGAQEGLVWASFPGEARADCALFREVFGNPFRLPAPIAPAVLAYNGGAVRRLARVIYEGRRFEDLPVLADLLEEAGLTDAALLGHLRGPGPHALGCHALDAVLGKA